MSSGCFYEIMVMLHVNVCASVESSYIVFKLKWFNM